MWGIELRGELRCAGIRSKDEKVKGEVEGRARLRAAAESVAELGSCDGRSVKARVDVDAKSLSNISGRRSVGGGPTDVEDAADAF